MPDFARLVLGILVWFLLWPFIALVIAFATNEEERELRHKERVGG